MVHSTFICICICMLFPKDNEAFGPDKILLLPGVAKLPKFDMYSGYLDVSRDKKLHYWLNICESGSCDDLIIWFNGGPGCSSMDGLFVEHGPFKFSPVTGRLETNYYSWNRFAHTLYIEAPVGVGFSYDTSNEPVSDDTVAEDLLKALVNFFEKFPFLRNNDLYISGESYAGVYVPTIVEYMLASGSDMTDRIQGLIIGNGLLDTKTNDRSLIFYAYYHGLFGKSMWERLLNNCCDHGISDECDFYKNKNEECLLQIIKVRQIINNGGLNVYNLYANCATESQTKLAGYLKENFKRLLRIKGISKKIRRIFSESPLSLVPPCANATLLTDYMNREDVQQAIHVKPTKWELCSDNVHGNYKRIYKDVAPFLTRILNNMNARILLYFGDVDMACNHVGGEWFVDSLNEQITMPRRTWSVDRDGSEQIAGFVKEMGKLIYATVKGAGHMVPSDDPVASFHMIRRFLDYEPL